MGDGNSFPFVVWLLLVILACKSIVLCKCSGNHIIGYECFPPYRTRKRSVFHLTGPFAIFFLLSFFGWAEVILNWWASPPGPLLYVGAMPPTPQT